MNPTTINTILNTAPVVLQGANRLVRLIRERRDQSSPQDDATPPTVDGLKQELERIGNRLDANDEADMEQIQLIEQLARQNEALAASLHRLFRRIILLIGLSAAAVIASILALIIQFLA